MSKTITGQCHCKQITYEVLGEKEFEFFCHCTDCQKLNGGGRLAGLLFNRVDFKPSGTTKAYTYAGGSGNTIEAHFCENCGTTVYAYPHMKEGSVVIRANTLDDPTVFEGKTSIFGESALHWDQPATPAN